MLRYQSDLYIYSNTVVLLSDINECNESNGNCSQICTNTEGSCECSCRDGYNLGGDGQNCSGTRVIYRPFSRAGAKEFIQNLATPLGGIECMERYGKTKHFQTFCRYDRSIRFENQIYSM